MSVDAELWTCADGDLGGLLPGSPDWDVRVSNVPGDGFEFEGDGWLLPVSAPGAVAAGEVPAELAALVDGAVEDLADCVPPVEQLIVGRVVGVVGHLTLRCQGTRWPAVREDENLSRLRHGEALHERRLRVL